MVGPSASLLLAALAAASVVAVNCTAHVNADADEITPSEWVRLHNAYRQTMYDDVKVPPVSWDDSVAAYARWYANEVRKDCEFKHSKEAGRLYGENLAISWDGLEPDKALSMWAEEREGYDCGSNSCSIDLCGHYTQLMWSNTRKIGCAQVKCDMGPTFITCNNSPPGNVPNERPYPCPEKLRRSSSE